MKKKIILIVVFLFCKMLFSQVFMDGHLFNTYYYAMDDYINIRAEPTVKSKSLGKLFSNEEIIVNKEKSTDEWFFCYIPKYDCIGYCFSSYFKYKPSIDEVIDLLLNNDKEILSMIESGNVRPICLDVLIKEQLKKLDENNCLIILKYAYSAGCNYSSVDDTTLIEAVKLNYYLIVNYLLTIPEFKDEINIKKNQFAPPLFWALWNGNIRIVELLLNNGADPNYETAYSTKAFENIEEFVEMKKITNDKAEQLKKMLIQYGYVKEK